MIRLLVTDVDGTLVPESQNQLNPDYFPVIRELKAKGIQVVAASGRPYSSIRSLFEPVAEDIWYIADCGVAIKTTGEIRTSGEIPRPWVEELWHDISLIPTADGMICGTESIYVPHRDSPMVSIVRDDYKMKTDYLQGWGELPKEPTGKVSLFCMKNVEELATEYLYPKWKDRLHLVISGEWWLDCMMPNQNKGTALEEIMADHGYTADEIMATGDNMNDIEMLTLAGTAYAVSSARDAVKKVADQVIGNFEVHGVLEEWKKLL